MTAFHHRSVDVAGRRLFYREAGARNAKTIVLLHGFPASSYTCDEGFVTQYWQGVWAYQAEQTPENEARVRKAFELDNIRSKYIHRFPDETLVSPDSWFHDFALISRPGNDQIQLKLFRDYATNSPLFPAVHEYFRRSQVPLLAVWGKNDPIFGPAGALAFQNDLPDAEVHLFDGGHFLLESALDAVVPLIRQFLAKIEN